MDKDIAAVAGDLVVPAAGDRLEPTALREMAAVAEPAEPAAAEPEWHGQRGMVSAEWAVGIIAAVAIAGVLLSVVTSGPVEAAILKLILQAVRAFSGGLGRL